MKCFTAGAAFGALNISTAQAQEAPLPSTAVIVKLAQLSAYSLKANQTPIPKEVTLPHRWDKDLAGQNGTASYVLNMPAIAQTTEQKALYVSRIGNQVIMYALQDGRKIKLINFGELGDAYVDAAKSPHWIALPEGIIDSTRNWQLEIHIGAQTGRYAGLSRVYFGNQTSFRYAFESNELWRKTSSQLIVLALGLLGFLSAGIWFKQRDTTFILFSVTALLGMVRMSDRLIEQTWLAWPWWGAMMATAYIWHLLFMVRFCLQMTQTWNANFLRTFWATIALSLMMTLISFGFSLPGLWTLTLSSLAIPAFYALWRIWRVGYQKRSRELVILGVCSLLLIAVGIRDFVSVRLARGEDLSFSWMPMALFAFVLSMAWIIVERFSRQVQAFRELNASLEHRVAQRDQELKQSYQQLKTTDEERATLAERARIMRDIHDGVGAQLVGLVSMLQNEEKKSEVLQEHAQSALDELRMAVDSLQPVEGSLTTVLATLRYRLAPRLKAAGIDVQWEVDELPQLAALTPSSVLQIQRILLEAFTNVIRHSGAKVLQVRATHRILETGNSCLSLCVDDDGALGSSSTKHDDRQSHGQGKQNMRWRAQAIGAQLYLEKSPLGGERVRMEWTLNKH